MGDNDEIDFNEVGNFSTDLTEVGNFTTDLTEVGNFSSDLTDMGNFSTDFIEMDNLSADEFYTFVRYFVWEQKIDFAVATYVMMPMVFFGLFGNFSILMTFYNIKRMTFNTGIYYKFIAATDFCLCLTLALYVLRAWVPFRYFYMLTFYETYFLYFSMDIFQFASYLTGTVLCIKLCYGILQSRKLKRTVTNAKSSKILLAAILIFSIALSVLGRLINSKEIVSTENDTYVMELLDNCSRCSLEDIRILRGIRYEVKIDISTPNEQRLYEISFYSSLGVQIFCFSVTSLLSILLITWLSFTKCGKANCILYNSDSSSNGYLNNPSKNTHQRAWQNQRKVCHLFLLLSFCYNVGLLPYLIGKWLECLYDFHKDGNLCQEDFETILEYEICLKKRINLHIFYSLANVLVNAGHVVPFYVYIVFCQPFRRQFFSSCLKIKTQIRKICFHGNADNIELSLPTFSQPPLPVAGFYVYSYSDNYPSFDNNNHVHFEINALGSGHENISMRTLAHEIPGRRIRRWGRRPMAIAENSILLDQNDIKLNN